MIVASSSGTQSSLLNIADPAANWIESVIRRAGNPSEWAREKRAAEEKEEEEQSYTKIGLLPRPLRSLSARHSVKWRP